MIAIVDTGGANLASIENAFHRLNREVIVSSEKTILDKASHLILPGVGHAATAAQRLKDSDLVDYLKKDTRPILGICLGMQLFYSFLEEGPTEGLGILPGVVTALKATDHFRVPHMGWSVLDLLNSNSILLKGVSATDSFYFIHSFETPMNSYVTSVTTLPFPISATVEYKNIFGTQFHPEKSSAAGEKILKNFLNVTKNFSNVESTIEGKS